MISFVYFDVGGVAEFDFSGRNMWPDLKKEMGVTEENDAAWEAVWSQFKNRVCIDCDVNSLVPIFKEKAGLTLPGDYSMLDAFVKRFALNPSIWPVIQAAKAKYRLGLLTNAYPGMLDAIFEAKLIPPRDEWEIIVDSSEVGYQKPDPEIFEIAIEKAGVPPEEIFFVENSQEHIDAAKKLGIQTFLYDPSKAEESSAKLMEMLLDLSPQST